MNKEQRPFVTNCYSIAEYTNTPDVPEVIYQKSQQIHEHQVPYGYQILSKNDFGKIKKRINVGYFNKKTVFLIGEKKSLLVWDNIDLKIDSPDTSVIIAPENKNRYFLIYDMNFIIDDTREEIDVLDKTTNEHLGVTLNKQFGNDIGIFLQRADPSIDVIPDEFQILKAIIKLHDGRMSIEKQVLVNSNPSFLLGILEGYIGDHNQFILQHNINIYNITYILNLLGAQYSIPTLQNLEKQVRFKLPSILRKETTLKDIFFRIYKYKFQSSDDSAKQRLTLTKNEELTYINPTNDLSFYDIVNSGLIEMIPVKDLVFLPIEDQVMYDLTMSNIDATNYSLPCIPTLKNSDGDILGAIAMMTKDGAAECAKKFSVEYKVNFLNLNDGSVNSWGVKLDSASGLYTATK